MNNLKKEPFVRYKLDEQKDLEKGKNFTIRLNEAEYSKLQQDKAVLNQPKDSTAIKQLAELGRLVLHDELNAQIRKTLFINKRNNKRLGILDFEE